MLSSFRNASEIKRTFVKETGIKIGLFGAWRLSRCKEPLRSSACSVLKDIKKSKDAVIDKIKLPTPRGIEIISQNKEAILARSIDFLRPAGILFGESKCLDLRGIESFMALQSKGTREKECPVSGNVSEAQKINEAQFQN